MASNAAVIEQFYTAFARRDAEAMVACYADDVVFSDPVCRELRGDRAKAMWRMLAGRSRDLQLTFRDVAADEQSGHAHWEATYTFGQPGRKVHNVIEARFRFLDGAIVEHRDTFDLWRWSRMALGPRGVLLGWTPFVQNAIHKTAIKGLDAYMSKGGGQGAG